jgi:hypothetical protein
MKRALVVVSMGCLAVACSQAGGGVASTDAGDDAAAPCLFCDQDASTLEPWLNESLPLGTRMKSLLGGCDSAEACHSAGSGGLVILGGGKEFVNLIGVASTERPELLRVAPGDPAASYLWLKLRGDGGIDGSPMPSGNPDPRRATLAWHWIEAGAPVP